MNIDELLKGAEKRLTSISDTAQLDASLLLSHVMSVSTSYFYTWPEKLVSAEQMSAFDVLLKRRENGEPIAYLLGHQDFWTLELEVAPCTLIPRADTERLVEVALSIIDEKKSCRILDLGTGTGAIALALASELSGSKVTGVDLIADAVSLAKRNAERNGIQNVDFIQSSWFDSLDKTERFDLIVSNPPYIDPEDEHLSQGDVRFEPKSALIANNHGLADIEYIIETARDFLLPDAYLAFEHGYDQAFEVQKRFVNTGFAKVESFQDLGGNDRVTIGRWCQTI